MMFQSWQKYESPERWASYFTQVNEILKFAPRSCLEIGVGNGIVGSSLRAQGIQLTTLDIDPGLRSDAIGSVEHIPFDDQSFDVVLCAEVLEHLPFEKFEACLQELARVCRVGAVLSLPHWGYTIRWIIDLPWLGKIRRAWKLPIYMPHQKGGEHYWEIGKIGYPSKRIASMIKRYFTIEKEYLLVWMPYHRFYRLKKK